MRIIVLTVIVALVLSRVAAAQAPVKAQSITVTTALPKAAAGERVAAALVDAGYALAEASPTVIRTERRTFKNIWDIQLRTSILAVDSSTTRVVLSGVFWVTCCGAMKRDNEAVDESHSGVTGKMWEQLIFAADRIKSALPPGPQPSDSTPPR